MNDDIEKAWADFHREPVKKSTLGGEMEGLSAQMNQINAKLDEALQKIGNPGMSAPDQGGVPAEQGEGVPAEGGAPPGLDALLGGASDGAPGEEMPVQDEAPMDIPASNQVATPFNENNIEQLFGGQSNTGAVDPTLGALQGAISSAADPEVIKNLAEIILDYTDKVEAEGAQQEMMMEEAMAAQQAPSEEEIAALIPMLAEITGGEPGMNDMDALSKMASEHSDIFAEFTSIVKSNYDMGVKDMSLEELIEPLTRKFEEIEEKKKKSDDADTDEKEVESKEEKTESKESESKEIPEKKKDDEMEIEIEVEASPVDTPISSSPVVEEQKTVEDAPKADPMKVQDIMSMPMKDIIDLAASACECKENDPNSFISGGEPTDPIIACKDAVKNYESLNRSAYYDLDAEVNKFAQDIVGVDGLRYKGVKKSMYTTEGERVESLIKSMTSKDDVSKMTVGDVFNNISFLKKSGVKDVDRLCSDSIDLISRFTDANLGGSDATDVLMCSMGIDMDAVFENTESLTKAYDSGPTLTPRFNKGFINSMDPEVLKNEIAALEEKKKAEEGFGNTARGKLFQTLGVQHQFGPGTQDALNLANAKLALIDELFGEKGAYKGLTFDDLVSGLSEILSPFYPADSSEFSTNADMMANRKTLQDILGGLSNSTMNYKDLKEDQLNTLNAAAKNFSIVYPLMMRIAQTGNQTDVMNALTKYGKGGKAIPESDEEFYAPRKNLEALLNYKLRSIVPKYTDVKDGEEVPIHNLLYSTSKKGNKYLNEFGLSDMAMKPESPYFNEALGGDRFISGLVEKVLEDAKTNGTGVFGADHEPLDLSTNEGRRAFERQFYPEVEKKIGSSRLDDFDMGKAAQILGIGPDPKDPKNTEWDQLLGILGGGDSAKGQEFIKNFADYKQGSNDSYSKVTAAIDKYLGKDDVDSGDDDDAEELGKKTAETASETHGKELETLSPDFASLKKSGEVYKSPAFAASGQTMIGDIEAVMKSNREYDLDIETEYMARIKGQNGI